MARYLTKSSMGLVRTFVVLLFSMALVMALLPATALAASGEPEAFAVYDEGTKTLSFHKQEAVPAAGETFTGSDGVERTATVVYSNFENVAHEKNYDVPWRTRGFENVVVVDKVSPVSTLGWFDGHTRLVSADLAKLDTSRVTTMKFMFRKCSSLTSLDVSSFDTSNVTDFTAMFNSCTSLTAIDLRSFETSNATIMGGMFSGCTSLVEADLSSFDLSGLEKAPGSLFLNCTSLVTVYAGEKWSLDRFFTQVTRVPVFQGCTNLVGCLGTKYNDAMKYEMIYARIDGGEQGPGLMSTHGRPLGTCSISGIDRIHITDGELSEEEIILMDGEKVLQKDIDYSVLFTTKSKLGLAHLTLIGKGEYQGEITRAYRNSALDADGKLVYIASPVK